MHVEDASPDPDRRCCLPPESKRSNVDTSTHQLIFSALLPGELPSLDLRNDAPDLLRPDTPITIKRRGLWRETWDTPRFQHVKSFRTRNSPADCRRTRGRRGPWRRSVDTTNGKGTQHPEPWLGSLWWMFHSCPQSSLERWFYCRPENNDRNSQIRPDHAELQTSWQPRAIFTQWYFRYGAQTKLPFAPSAHWTRPEPFCRSKSYRYFAFQAYYTVCGTQITSWATVIKWHLYMTKTKLTHTEIMIFKMRYESFLTFLYELVKHRSHLNLRTLWSA